MIGEDAVEQGRCDDGRYDSSQEESGAQVTGHVRGISNWFLC
jgi:hypothetical protein